MNEHYGVIIVESTDNDLLAKAVADSCNKLHNKGYKLSRVIDLSKSKLMMVFEKMG